MKQLDFRFENICSKGRNLALLFLRLALAYGFWEPARTKWTDIGSVAEWFGSISIPAPAFNAYLAAGTEMLGVFLLPLGLGTRIICLPLIIVMLVAIKTVHWEHGFAAGDNGWEIPFYYLLMLFTLMTFGAGKLSLDHFIRRSRKS